MKTMRFSRKYGFSINDTWCAVRWLERHRHYILLYISTASLVLKHEKDVDNGPVITPV